jgi:tetratricopeptide (TPR) repeat protein
MPTNLNEAIQSAADSLAADPAAAERLIRPALAQAPADPRARLIFASSCRRQGRAAEALAILQPLAAAWPKAANTQFELGTTLAALGRDSEAVEPLSRAVSLNRDLSLAWKALGEALFRLGEDQDAERAFAEYARTQLTDPVLKPIAEALFARRYDEAEARLRSLLVQRPNDPDALRLLAQALIATSRPDEGEKTLHRCLALAPDDHAARFMLANLYFLRQIPAAALAQVRLLLRADPQEIAYLSLEAGCLARLGETDRVTEINEGLAARFPAQPKMWLNVGHSHRTAGDRVRARAAYERALALAPGFGEAWWALANLKVEPFSDADVGEMTEQLAGASDRDRLHLHFALGKAHEDRKAFAAAFDHYAAGSKLHLATAPHDASAVTARIDRAIGFYTRELIEARAGQGDPSDAPIFVVGLPRSGSTLVEQILASHSAVEGTMELPEIANLVMELEASARRHGASWPEALADLSSLDLARLGAAFLEGAAAYRRTDRPRFIDKMPTNFLQVGLITLILPNAKIVDVRRHPMAVGFSCFKQHFEGGASFSYDLTDIGRWYADYARLMDHFDEAAPGRVHRVIYEDLVEDTEGEVRRLLAALDLPFETACLAFHENRRAVRTISSEQVRRPIFRDGLDQWRNFEPWLGPLALALGGRLASWRG